MNEGGGGEMGTPDRREGGKNYSLPEISKIQKEPIPQNHGAVWFIRFRKM